MVQRNEIPLQVHLMLLYCSVPSYKQARRIPANMEPAILCHTLKIAPGSVARGLAAKLAAASETARPLFYMPTSIAIAVVLE